MRWRNGLLTASSALLLAGCGGGDHRAAPPPPPPRIPADVAALLVGRAEQVAALTPGTCAARDAAARFRADVIASIGRVPPRYREPLMSAANSLAERLAACVEPKPEHDEKPRERHHEKRHEKDGHD